MGIFSGLFKSRDKPTNRTNGFSYSFLMGGSSSGRRVNEIARIFRVPPHMVGDLEKSSFSNIERQSLEFVKYTFDPWVARWEQSIVRRLFTEEEKKKYYVKFNVDGLLVETTNQE